MFKFNRTTFFQKYREAFGSVQQLQVEGIEFLLGKIESDPEWKSIPQVSYFFATIKHETGIERNGVLQTYQPIKELRGRAGTKIRAIQDRYWGTDAFGRGLIQITWPANYAKFGLSKNEYDKALEPDTAYDIAARGMRKGMFTKFRLSDFINDKEVDYFNARRIVNGLDKAEQIAGYAQKFERILKASLVTDSVTDSPQPVKEEPKGEEPQKDPPPASISEPSAGVSTVQKVAQSVGSQVMSGGTLGAGVLTAIAGAFLGVVRNPYAFAILILGCAGIAAYLWNQSKNRQLDLQKDLNAKAAAKNLNTVEIKPPELATQ